MRTKRHKDFSILQLYACNLHLTSLYNYLHELKATSTLNHGAALNKFHVLHSSWRGRGEGELLSDKNAWNKSRLVG